MSTTLHRLKETLVLSVAVCKRLFFDWSPILRQWLDNSLLIHPTDFALWFTHITHILCRIHHSWSLGSQTKHDREIESTKIAQLQVIKIGCEERAKNNCSHIQGVYKMLCFLDISLLSVVFRLHLVIVEILALMGIIPHINLHDSETKVSTLISSFTGFLILNHSKLKKRISGMNVSLCLIS